ncbi:hypothetical protein ACN47E_004844 [Coniothyrium glycines]
MPVPRPTTGINGTAETSGITSHDGRNLAAPTQEADSRTGENEPMTNDVSNMNFPEMPNLSANVDNESANGWPTYNPAAFGNTTAANAPHIEPMCRPVIRAIMVDSGTIPEAAHRLRAAALDPTLSIAHRSCVQRAADVLFSLLDAENQQGSVQVSVQPSGIPPRPASASDARSPFPLFPISTPPPYFSTSLPANPTPFPAISELPLQPGQVHMLGRTDFGPPAD